MPFGLLRRQHPATDQFLYLAVVTAELHQLYAASKLFWHATGLGEDEVAHPERFEHFGITTVEAMAAGCVPVVLGKGGQPEIVHSGVDGILWSSEDELVAQTISLVQDENRRMRLAAAARARAWDFDQSVFRVRLDEVLSPREIPVGDH